MTLHADRADIIELLGRYADITDSDDLPRPVHTDPFTVDFESVTGMPHVVAFEARTAVGHTRSQADPEDIVGDVVVCPDILEMGLPGFCRTVRNCFPHACALRHLHRDAHGVVPQRLSTGRRSPVRRAAAAGPTIRKRRRRTA